MKRWQLALISSAAGLAGGALVWRIWDPVEAKIREIAGKAHKSYSKAQVDDDGTETLMEVPAGVNEGPRPSEDHMTATMIDYSNMVATLGYSEWKAATDMEDDAPTEWHTVGRIDLDRFMDLPEDRRHVCTWYKADKVLAGMDDELEEMNPLETLGATGSAYLGECEESSLFLLRHDDGVGFEVVMSDEPYEDDYAEYQRMRASMGDVLEE